MDKKVYIILSLLLVSGLFVIACDCPPNCPTSSSSSATSSSSTCPPISGPITKQVSQAGDVSSITIPNGTTGTYDSGGYWCATADLNVEKINVNNKIQQYGCFNNRNIKNPPCDPANALAAVDVQPTGVSFGSIPKPQLRYDLSVTDNKPRCTVEGTNCGGYEFYQLKDPIPTSGVAWLPVGDGIQSVYNSKSVVEGAINHFSTFALVELPAPRTLPPPAQAEMIVDSAFLDDDQKGIRAAFELVKSDLPEMGDTLLFRFSNIDPAWEDPNLPPECLQLATPAEQLTCFMPIGMTVIFETGVDGVANLNRFVSIDKEYVVQFYANVEIY